MPGGSIIPGPADPIASDVNTGFPFPTFHSNAKEHPVLWDFDHYNELMEMPLPVIRTGTQNMGNGVYWLKAGTPLSEEGAVANTSDAVCVVAEDFYFYENKPNQAKLVKVIVKGYVDLAEAEARSGLTYTEDALSALETAGVVMVDGKLAASGGGGGGSSGGGLPSYTNDDIGKSLKLADSGETTTETVITIPEQTFVSDGRGEGSVVCTPEYPWTVGETIHLTVNNEVHDCVVRVLEGRVPDALGISAELAGGGSMEIEWSDGSQSNVLCPAEETFVVSATKEASVPVAAPAWVSGGSDLPEYTPADNEKALVLAPNGAPETTTFIEEQTVVCDQAEGPVYRGDLAEGTFNFDLLSDGAMVDFNINGQTVSATALEQDGSFRFLFPPNSVDGVRGLVFTSDGSGGVATASEMSVTISAEVVVQNVSPIWDTFPAQAKMFRVTLNSSETQVIDREDGANFNNIRSFLLSGAMVFLMVGNEISNAARFFPCTEGTDQYLTFTHFDLAEDPTNNKMYLGTTRILCSSSNGWTVSSYTNPFAT